MSDQSIFAGLQPFSGTELDTYEWDYLYLAGERWPGICEVSGSGVSRRVDAKATKGSDGAVLKDEGMNLAKLTIKLTLWNEEQWTMLQELLPSVHPRRAGGARTPTSIITPYTRLLGIDNIYITAIPVPALDKSKQILTVTMQAIEWVPTPKPVKHGVGGTGGGGGYSAEEHLENPDSPVDWDKLGNTADLIGEKAKEAWDDSPADKAIEGVTGLGKDAVDGFLDNLGLGDGE